MFNVHGSKLRKPEKAVHETRISILAIGCIIVILIIIIRLFFLQIVHGGYYQQLALHAREIHLQISPARGEIFTTSHIDGTEYPLILNEDRFLVYADGRTFRDKDETLNKFKTVLHLDDTTLTKIDERLTKLGADPYEPIIPAIVEYEADALRILTLPGIGFIRLPHRFYPEAEHMSHITGFLGREVNDKRTGQYGLEGYFDAMLEGASGSTSKQQDGTQHGARIVTTIDPAIQRYACDILQTDAKKYEAKSATLIIMDPRENTILALCNSPQFDANNYKNETSISIFNNSAIYIPYEPGSVMKAITMAAAIDSGTISKDTTFIDRGYENIDGHTIKNAAEKVYGLSSMTQVLIDSINTGAIFAARSIGIHAFAEYMNNFGFGKVTGIELDTEATGTVDNLARSSEVYLATASFGQGITATPLQLITAYSVLAHQGKLLKPTIIDSITYADGTIEKKENREIRQVISPRTAFTLSQMLAEVISSGHAHRAGVPGILIAGKTGTAQIASQSGGYNEETYNHTFIGYGPADNPQFIMLIKYEQPNERYADATTANTFGAIAKFLVQYLKIPPDN